jgi:hypothetical protein
MDESRRLAMRRKHATYAHFCSCGRVVFGNGAQASHRAMHERRGDGHHYLIRSAWVERFGEPFGRADAR